ncbi:MAG: DUF4326 domain-containing protein [Planctomycetota bacterium]
MDWNLATTSMADKVENPRRVVARVDTNYRAVHRPSRWGNPFLVARYGLDEALKRYEEWLDRMLAEDPDFLEPLRGYNLGCFCPTEVACHADIILSRLYGQRPAEDTSRDGAAVPFDNRQDAA